MPALPFPTQQKVKFHLAYSDAVPLGDAVLLENRMNTIASTELVTLITEQVARCDRVFGESELNKQTAGITYNRIITGDVNRTDREDRSEPTRLREKAYLRECDRLALSLGVLNYRNPENHQYLHFGVVKQ